MVERWNIGFQKDISHFNFIVNPADGGTINPTLQYPKTHFSNIPAFQHSNLAKPLTCWLMRYIIAIQSKKKRKYWKNCQEGLTRFFNCYKDFSLVQIIEYSISKKNLNEWYLHHFKIIY
jgi:hypothetical protein